MTSSDAVRGPMPGTVRRQPYVASSASRAAISTSSLAASSAASDILLASILTCGFSAATCHSDGLVDETAASHAASTFALSAPRVTAPSEAFPTSRASTLRPIGRAAVSEKDGVAGKLSSNMSERLAKAEGELSKRVVSKRYDHTLGAFGRCRDSARAWLSARSR